MSLFRDGGVSALVFGVLLAACADSKTSPVAPTEPALAAKSVSPTAGRVSGGTPVALTGSGFREGRRSPSTERLQPMSA